MDMLVLIGAILGLYAVVALIIYGPRFRHRDDDVATRQRPRKDWRQYWL